MEIDVMAMAKELVVLRGEKTQEDVAKELGISRSALCMYESGQRVPRDPLKARIAKYYKRSIAFIFLMKKNTKRDFFEDERE